jgi:hypothetical protein|tara:strand:- start:3 stop:614 length:612 start_codon:yes stop_codon:yes gene_type:complete
MALVKYNNNSISSVTALDSIASGGLNLLATNTISSGVSSSSFTSSIDSTYDTYMFKFINMHPASSNTHFRVNFRDGGSDFDASKTTTTFFSRHKEDDSGASLGYDGSRDLANGTGYQDIYFDTGANASDECGSGTLFLFSPSSTTFVKHFISVSSSYGDTPRAYHNFMAGYCNTTSAIDGVDFKFSSGNIDSGVIKMYGLSKS